MKRTISTLDKQYIYWNKTSDLIDQCIDITLNYRQSGHPGGSRSKVHLLVSLMLSGAMRWDIRDSDKRFGDKFVLGCGHTIPLVYATLAVLNEALRLRYKKTKDGIFTVKDAQQRMLVWEDLIGFRHCKGLSGHAEANGKTSFLKANTGPSGHGTPAAAGLAFSLKRSGASNVKVFLLEGEGGLTPGATHETANTAWSMALDNLHMLIDWNDYGIDDHKASDVIPGTPEDWLGSHDWRVVGTEKGSEYPALTTMLDDLVNTDDEKRRPSAAWFKTRKGRGYGKYDAPSHGSPHAMNSSEFWKLRKEFAKTYGAAFFNVDGPAPTDVSMQQEEMKKNLQAVMDVLAQDEELYTYLSDRLVEIGDSVPEEVPDFCLNDTANPFEDDRFWDAKTYPHSMWAMPGEMKANRMAMGVWGAYINTLGKQLYNRPLFLASSADLSASTNLWGFASGYEGEEGYGWYERVGSNSGVMAPTEITEFSNAGMLSGVASLNLSKDPKHTFDGFYGAISTYASFSYLKYGPMRLFSQYAQDADIKVGKVLWVGAHSGPETADDSRTHFGIFSVGVHTLFPKGQVINLHPWDYNEVPVLLAEAFKTEVPIISLHVTRPAYPVVDRKALGIPSHFSAAKGAYILRNYEKGKKRSGCIFVQGTSAVHSVIALLPKIQEENLNVKLVCVTSTELFARQGAEYRDLIIGKGDFVDSTFITTQAKQLMGEWNLNPLSEQYCISSDHDNRWRSGGNLEEILEEAHLNEKWVFNMIKKFAEEREERLAWIAGQLSDALST